MRRLITGMCAIAAFGLAGRAMGQLVEGQSVRVVTTRGGTFLVRNMAATKPGRGFRGDSLWTFTDPISIPQSGVIGGANSTWIGEALNTERAQRFATNGDGTPLAEFPGTHATFNPAEIAAAKGADFAVFMDQNAQGGVLEVRAYNSTIVTGGQPLWTFDLPANYNYADLHFLKVSRNGAVVAVLANDNTNQTCRCYFLDSTNGNRISVWDPVGTMPGGSTGVDLTDDGSKAIICHVSTARVIDTATGNEVFTATGSGAGGRYNISGDGSVLVVGGFSLQVYKLTGGTYQQVINFSAPTSWFAWGSAVSRDGSTVGVLTHDYGANYLNTAVRIWDVNSHALLGTVNSIGTGTLQDSAWDAAMSDHGERFIVASWGTQNNDHPQVRIFDRSVHLVDSLTTRGSPWAVDITGDGSTALATNKAVHANTFGNGGDVTLFTVAGGTSCYANCDNSTATPILNVNDFICFQTKFAAGDSYANCDGSTSAPVLNVNDFICFQTRFAQGCP